MLANDIWDLTGALKGLSRFVNFVQVLRSVSVPVQTSFHPSSLLTILSRLL